MRTALPPPLSAQPTEEAMWSDTNLMVCRLRRSVGDRDVWKAFAAFGEIESSMVMRNIHSGESTGTAFVRFSKHEAAEAARQAMHKSGTLGRKISVRWARAEHDATPAGAARWELRELFLRNVPMDVTERQLEGLVAPFGTATRVQLCEDTEANEANRRRIAFVEFAEGGAAQTAFFRLHARCPFPSCGDVPLLCKLKEDYTRNGRCSTAEATTPSTPGLSLPHTPRMCAAHEGSASIACGVGGCFTARRTSAAWVSTVASGGAPVRVRGNNWRHDPYASLPLCI